MRKILYILAFAVSPFLLHAQTLSIGDGASLTIGVGASASYGTASSSGTVSSDANSKLIIESSASGSGSLICGGTPNATVNRYITDNEWHLVTPITSPSNASDFYLGAENRSWFAKHNESDDSWTYIITVDTAITRPTGFSYWIEDSQGPQTIDFTGTLVGTDLTAALIKNGNGWNLIGNPYPSALNWDGVAAGNTTGTCYVWDNSAAGYLYSNGSTGTLQDNIIPMGQGFFVQAASAGNFTIPKANRVHSNNAFLKSSNSVNQGNVDFLRIDLNAGYFGNTVFVGFPENGTGQFDKNGDATKFYSTSEDVQFFALENDKELCVNANAPLSEGESKTVPLHLVQATNGSYVMSFTELENIAENISITLEDVKGNYFQNIRQLPTYNFNCSSDDDPARFKLHFEWSPYGIDDENLTGSGSTLRIYSYGKNIRILNNNEDPKEIMHVNVYDFYGRQVITNQTSRHDLTIPMDNYSNTYFVVQVTMGNSSLSEKVFIR